METLAYIVKEVKDWMGHRKAEEPVSEFEKLSHMFHLVHDYPQQDVIYLSQFNIASKQHGINLDPAKF